MCVVEIESEQGAHNSSVGLSSLAEGVDVMQIMVRSVPGTKG